MKKWQGIALLVTVALVGTLLAMRLSGVLGESGDWALAVATVVGAIVVSWEENLTGQITRGVFGLLLLTGGAVLGYRQYEEGGTVWRAVMAGFLVLSGLATIANAFTKKL